MRRHDSPTSPESAPPSRNVSPASARLNLGTPYPQLLPVEIRPSRAGYRSPCGLRFRWRIFEQLAEVAETRRRVDALSHRCRLKAGRATSAGNGVVRQ